MLSKSSYALSTLTRGIVAGRHISARAYSQISTRQPQLRLQNPTPLSRTASLSLPTLQHRSYASSEKSSPESIAIFGGGIAGLSSAYFIHKQFPEAMITVFEGGKETGGWIKSKHVKVAEDQHVIFELGPRTLRNSTITASLIQELGLIDQVTYTNKNEPGAKNRFIYYPDRLNRLPTQIPSLSEIFALWQSGMLGGAWSVLREILRPQRPDSKRDETIGAFITRRFDRRIADNIVSAGLHGIFAGDVHQLSAKTLLGVPWALERRYGTSFGGFIQMHQDHPSEPRMSIVHPTDLEAARAMNREIDLKEDFAKKLKDSAMFTFKDGLQTLVKALQGYLERDSHVQIKTDAPIQNFEPIKGGHGVQVTFGPKDNPTTSTFDLAISTLRDPHLTPYVTVQTVSLYFASPDLLPVEGFGYLIPQSVPFEQNPERALGVIFDSSAIQGQDSAPGTKVTVMMGGHWWDGWNSYPTEEEGLAAAQSLLERHLNITEAPMAHVVNLSRDCIPQYTLGYSDRLAAFATNLSSEFKGRLRVVGSQVNGVGVNDCIHGAWSVARGLRGSSWKGRSCGLDRALDEREWVVVPSREIAYQLPAEEDMEQGFSEGVDRRGDGGV